MVEFQFKLFEEMTADDYAEVGFKSGLEIHQQLLTEKKLFCRCPAGKYNNEEYHAEILRHMRPTLSELGEYDGTALMEFKTKKDIIYRINRETVCTYEMDDTPPFEINEQALDIAIEAGLQLGATIVDELHIARKQYLDGSIPTGFQRTAIVSVGGKIPYKDREIRMIQMSIEEDSCREFSDSGHTRTYLTDRLGMPLIETVTYPDMKTPQEVAEVNDLLRRLVRSTGKVRTGIGASREDVNVSVHGGTRIEIKGVHKIKHIPLLTYNEAMRQWNLLRLRDELKKKGITEKTFKAKTDDITHLLRHTDYQPIKDALKEGRVVKCVTLKGFKGLLNWKTQTDTYFSKEISDRVRVIACLDKLPNIINSDSYENTLSSADGQKIRKVIGAGTNDTLVIVWGSKMDAETAANEITIRAKEATIGIPSETRQALRDGTNGFERILPGPDRMYPDTDLPPKIILDDRKEQIRKLLPVNFWEYENYFKTLNIPPDVVRPLTDSAYSALFKKMVKTWKIDPVFSSVLLVQYVKHLKRSGFNINVLTAEVIEKIFKAYKDGKIVKDGVYYTVKKTAETGTFKKNYLLKPASADEIKKAIEKAKKKLKAMKLHNPDKKKDILIGLVMKALTGRVNGENVASIITVK
ncbi:Glu-tRNA(Gln) amidotransferase subunit GatE [Bacteroidota bacterium]